MTSEATTTSFVVSIVSTACLLGLTLPHALPAVKRCLSSNRKYQAINEIYEDKDGQATESSQAAFSDLFQRVSLIVLSVVGLALAAVSAVFTITQQNPSNDYHLIIQQWLQFASWVCQVFSVNMSADTDPLLGHSAGPIFQYLSDAFLS